MTDKGSIVVISSATAAVLVALQVASKAVRDALFLAEFGAEQLPKAVIGAAALSLISVAVVTMFVARFGPRRTTSILLAFSSVSLVGEFSLFASHAPIAVGLFYLHTAALGALVISGLWSAISECFDPNTARKNISSIAAWATAGGLAGGLLAERLSVWLSPQLTLLVIAGGHAVAALLVLRMRPLVVQRTESAVDVSIVSLAKNPYVRNLVLIVVFATAAGNVLDYVLKFTADQQLADDQLVRFFGVYYTLIGVVTFAVQVIVAKRILARVGVARTTMTLPIVAAIGSVLIVLSPTLIAATLARGTEAIVRNSLFRSSYELLFAPLSASARRRIKTWIDVGADRIGDMLGGALVASVLFLIAKPTLFFFGVLALSLTVAMLSIVGQLRERYQNALALALEDNDADTILAQTFAGFAGSEISMFTQTMFTSEKPFEFTFDLGDEPTETTVGGPAELLESLANDRLAAGLLEELRQWIHDDAAPFCDALVESQTPFIVRRRLPKLLLNGQPTVVVPALITALDDKRFEVRFQAARALYLIKNRGESIPQEVDTAALVLREVRIHPSVWNSRVALEKEVEQGLNELKHNRSLEHVFYLLCLSHDVDALKNAFRSITGDDEMMRGTAIEFVDSLLSADASRRLWTLIGVD